MFPSLASLCHLVVKLSVKIPTNQVDVALSWLRKAASTRTLSQEERRMYDSERPWISAPKLVVDGQTDEFDVRANGLIRWLQHPERSCSIHFDASDNMYTVQVKAAYYAIASAMSHRVSHAVIYSTNEIVVKVGNGLYKAKKEARLFKGIQRRTGMTQDGCDTSVRLCPLDDDTLTRLKWSRDSVLSRKNVPVCSENQFREQHCSEILRM